MPKNPTTTVTKNQTVRVTLPGSEVGAIVTRVFSPHVCEIRLTEGVNAGRIQDAYTAELRIPAAFEVVA